MKGSATSAVMVRGHSSQLECGQFPDRIEYENCTTDTCLSTPKSTSACMQIDFLQVKIFFIVAPCQIIFFMSIQNFMKRLYLNL